MAADAKLPKDFVAACATPLILSILNRGDSYGYAIIRDVRELSAGTLQWEDGMLYPILHRLEKRKLIESYPGVAENGRKRKYYRISRDGKAALDQQIGLWAQVNDMLKQLEGGVLCPA